MYITENFKGLTEEYFGKHLAVISRVNRFYLGLVKGVTIYDEGMSHYRAVYIIQDVDPKSNNSDATWEVDQADTFSYSRFYDLVKAAEKAIDSDDAQILALLVPGLVRDANTSLKQMKHVLALLEPYAKDGE